MGMSFKKYARLSFEEKKDDSYYLIGLDLGNNSTAIAYHNAAGKTFESIDLSGGYGKPSIPTAVQYIPDTKEWVIGEYAVQNQGAGVVFTDFLKRMGSREYVELGGRLTSLAAVFGVFIREVLLNIKNINPKAEIAGIVCTVPAYFSEEQKKELRQAFIHAGYEKELIGFASDRETVLVEYVFLHNVTDETVMLLDFGSRELRGGVYGISSSDNQIDARCLSFYFDEQVSTERLDAGALRLFESFLVNAEKGEYRDELLAFHFHHKDMLFQKNIRERPLKLYYNFVYPPIECKLTNHMADQLIKPYERKFLAFAREVEEKSKAASIDAVLCAGGGFEMLWAREAIARLYGVKKVYFAKSPKLASAVGASIMAASKAGLSGKAITLEDRQKLLADIGIYDGKSFLSLAHRNSFWWQKLKPKLVTVQEEVTGSLEFCLAKQEQDGSIVALGTVLLEGLPKRPKGVTRLEVSLALSSSDSCELVVADAGFGELFPASGFRAVFGMDGWG